MIKNPPANEGDIGSIPGLGRSLGEGNDNPLQYSYLENPMNRGVQQATVQRAAESDRTEANKDVISFWLCFRGGLDRICLWTRQVT